MNRVTVCKFCRNSIEFDDASLVWEDFLGDGCVESFSMKHEPLEVLNASD